MPKRSIRAGQLISPFGPGSVIDLGAESFACVDITYWPQGDCPVIPNNPLRPVLGLDVRSPPTGDRAGEVPLSRFPRWLFCPSCRRLYNLTRAADQANGGEEPACPAPGCKSVTLSAMRFVAACDQGHLQDVDWFRWAHRNSQASATGQCGRQTAVMYFKTTGASGGDFNAMTVSCSSCGASNTFEGLTQGPYAFGCAGRQPWQDYSASVSCGAVARVFPRAASNVYYPQTRSAIDLDAQDSGPAGDQLQAFQSWLVLQPLVGTLRGMARMFPSGVPKDLYAGMAQEAVRQFGIREEEALAGIAAAIVEEANPTATLTPSVRTTDNSQHGILRREWPHLARRTGINSKNLRTSVAVLEGAWPLAYLQVFEQVTLVERLREVRALIGFRRVRPDTASAQVPVDLGDGVGWLPGIESFGEGIFLKFRERAIADWEKKVVRQFAARSRELEDACQRWGRSPADLYASPRFIALHTFAHGFIRRLAFDAGYSSASIRERIYCDHAPEPAAGVLLYTAEGDSEGSLGGLVRQGEPCRLLSTIQRTLADLVWCSADPVCSELEAQGVDGMNAAACHACCLVSETSCGYNNSLLDRRLLVGSTAFPGLLEGLLEAVS